MSGREGLERLAGLLREQGGLIADAVSEPPAAPPPSPAAIAAAGPRAGGDPREYELLVEAIYEGYLLHHGSTRLLAAADPDLGVLAGDHLYALGLARLVELGDVEAVTELADVISLAALAHAAGDPELADAVWMAGANAVGWGSSETHERAKAMARDGAAGALDAMLTSAGERARST